MTLLDLLDQWFGDKTEGLDTMCVYLKSPILCASVRGIV